MKAVWTDINADRAAVSLSRNELGLIVRALDTEESESICKSATNSTEPGMDEQTAVMEAEAANRLKQRFEEVIRFMDESVVNQS